MNLTYWMLGVYTFLLLAAICYIAFPVLLIVIGLLTGFISIYRGLGTAKADMIISAGTYTWRNWWLVLFFILVATIAFVVVTDLLRHAERFRHIKVKKKKIK